MKTLVVAFCFVVTSAALAQSGGSAGVLANEPVVLQFNSHSAHASQQGMSDPQTIMEASNPMIATGERPAWEVAPAKATQTPLGDVARMVKKEKLEAKKSNTVWEN